MGVIVWMNARIEEDDKFFDPQGPGRREDDL